MMPLWLKIVLSIIAAEILGGLGGFITASSIGSWYSALERPPGTPPNAVFGPVWSVLYALMGIAFALIWHRAPAGPAKRRALIAFFIQLALNLAWTPVFFGAHQLAAAQVDTITLLSVPSQQSRWRRYLNAVQTSPDESLLS